MNRRSFFRTITVAAGVLALRKKFETRTLALSEELSYEEWRKAIVRILAEHNKRMRGTFGPTVLRTSPALHRAMRRYVSPMIRDAGGFAHVRILGMAEAENPSLEDSSFYLTGYR